MAERWYNTAEVAELLGAERETVRHWIRAGRLGAAKIEKSRSWRVSETHLAEFRKRELGEEGAT